MDTNNARVAEYALSSYQKDIWLEQCMYPGKPIYNLGGYIEIKGNIDIDIFRESIQLLIRQNDILRTRLIDRAGEAYLAILPEVLYTAPFHDFSMKENQAAFCIDWMKKEFLKPFWPKDYFLQFDLLKCGENAYFVFLKVYHMIIDGWGCALLYSQLVDNYNELSEGNCEIKRDAYSYTDFIADDQNYRNSPAFLKDREFWKNKYRTIPEPLLSKGIDSNYGIDNPIWSDRCTLKIKRVIYDRMVEFCKEENCSAFHYLLGILFLYFSKVCNQGDMVIGVPIFNRSNAKYKQTLGHFANLIPLRINPGKDMSFKELMKTIKYELLECYRHKRISFGEINRAVLGGGNDKENLFDISLSFEEQEIRKKFITADECRNVTMTHQHERNALMLLIWGHEGESDVCVNFDYRIQVFEKFIPIENFISHFEYLFTKAMEKGETPISKIEIIPEEEKRVLLHDFNRTVMEYPRDKTIHGLFEEQVEQRPDHTALVFRDKKLTYRELNKKANRLANILRRQGIKTDNIVAVMAERSLEMIVGILGTLKAGGAYLPIDPGYPEDRIRYMFKDSGASALLTQKHLRDKISYNGNIICLDDEELNREEDTNPDPVNKAEDLAYIIYTSGSTGKPKGVMVEHHGIINLRHYFKESLGVDGSDRMLQFASSSFDASVWETFTTLLGGGTLYLIPKDMINNLEEFKKFINENGITITLLPPAYLTGIEPGSLPALKMLVTGGSAITKELAGKWKDSVLYMNAYGPTEYSVIATTWKYREEDMGYDSVPIGKSIDNTRIYILDKDQRLLPVGVAGEMCISGEGMARGYLNRQSLTAEKFVDNPYEDREKMYRTGDLARFLPDGNVEYLGRIDDQVKIRGFRIELGEIEANLLKYPQVLEAAVIAREDKKKEKYLAAYFTAEGGPGADELREHLLKELPDYMVPSCFMQLAHMPITPSGKIDKKALPEPDISLGAGVEYVAPRNKTEEMMAGVWEKVLELERVGIRDNFFNLGGDSIKAIQVLSKLNGYKLKLEMKDIFEHPFIEELSAHIKSDFRTAAQGIVKGEVVLTPIQSWFFEQPFESKHHFNQSVMLYRKQGFNEEALRKVFDRLVEHHDSLRIIVREKAGRIVLLNRGMEGKLYSLEVKDFTSNENLSKALEEEAGKLQSCMDLRQGPLVKAGLFRTKEGDYLLLAIHHLVVDGISWRILFEDISTGYLQAALGGEIIFAEKTDSFKEWSEKFYAYADSEELQKEVEYWSALEQINIKPIPKEHTVCGRKYKGSDSVEMELDEIQTSRLIKEVNKAYNTEINDILLTALGEAIAEWTGEDRVLINLEGHGREEIDGDIDISRTVGWFTTQYPVILNMRGIGSLPSRLKSVKESLRSIPRKGIGYGILKYQTILQEEGSLKFNLNPEISFNYLGQFDQDIDNEIFTISDISTGETISPEMPRPYCIDIYGRIKDGKLKLSFTYHKDEYEKATMNRIAENFKRSLMQIIEHCVSRDYTELTPGDLSSRNITVPEVEAVYREMEVSKQNITDIYPLTPMQTGMLYHFLREKDSHAYFEQAVITLKGKVDKGTLERAFHQVIKRHDILRTAFVYEKVDNPVQVVLKDRLVKMYFEDISLLPEEQNNSYLKEYMDGDREKGFDFTREPLIRIALIKMSDDIYHLIWSFHHIIMDGWCLGIVFKELLEFYKAFREGSIPQLGKVYPYSQYIRWLENRDDQEASDYWVKYLMEYEQAEQLSRMKGGTGNLGYLQEEYDFKINEEMKTRLERTARDNTTTLSTMMQAVWGILLQRYSNTRDVVFGTVVSGRPAEIQGVERMVGLFINTIPVRVRGEKGESFSALVARLQREALESERHNYYPLAKIQSQTSHGGGLVQNLIAFENYPMEEALKGDNNSGLDFIILSANISEQTNFDLNLIIVPEKDLQIKFRYNSLTYNRNFFVRIAEQIKTIISTIVHSPDIPIEEINVVPEEEKRMLLHDFNRTMVEYPKDKTIHGLFEEQVEQRPDHTALVFRDKKLTYRELNKKANRLANVLRRQGIKTDNIVAVMTERSLEMIVGILGTLKAGGAYLPIDPSYPEDRIRYMLKDSGATVLLTQKHLRDKITYNGNIICLDDEGLSREGDTNTEPVNKAEDLAYIIYTSGSTGKPKGVMVEHHGIINLQHYCKESLGVDGSDRMLQFASSSFDASVWETFTILLGGGTLYLIPKDIINNLEEFKNYINENGITITLLPPAYLTSIEPGSLPALKRLVTGGSAITKELAGKWKDGVLYMNAYGPTEYSVIATTWKYREEDMGYNSVPIGKPVDNTRIYILDKDQRLLPVGAAGEMCISGEGLARGYLNRQSLTAEKFVDNPYEGREKMYRTGDLARWLPDGNVEYLGRIDDQVKIRGFRIELGEIEANLLKYPQVLEAAVIAREDKQKEKYLAAYFTAEGEQGTGELREHLLKELPDYMVPSCFMQLEHMPMTPSGKIDKKVLPEPEWRGNYEAGTGSPRNDIDMKIQEVWQEILTIEPIGIDDNFFMLGGNSIKAIQTVSRLALDFEVGINDIFTYPTIRSLSEQIKYSKDRLKKAIYALQEVAAARNVGMGVIDGKIRRTLREYHKRNQVYETIEISERAGYHNILLVGGTGYLGIQILHELLQNTDFKIYVPVRGKNDSEARERLRAKLKFHFGLENDGQNVLEDRLYVFCGDLTKEYFGLSQERYEDLAGKIDAIINSAANVKHFGNYSEFYAINVEGNERLIEFAGTGKKKVYNFISTTSVGSGLIEDQHSVVFTEYDYDIGQSSDNYYVMTKLEAEKQIVKAREKGIECNVFRVGNLVFDSNSGIFQENIQDNAFYSLVKSMIKLGYFPAITDKTMDFSFVDQVAKAVVLLFDRKNLKNETYHLFNSHQINMISFAQFLNQAGVDVQTMPVEEFTAYLLEKYDEEEARQEVSRILVHSNIFFEGASKTLFLLKNRKTDGILKALGFEWPLLNSKRVKLMIEHCKKVGFM
ncbi:MAG: amino acid adenylation domain-containing protein [Anaerocolumna sp.]